MFLLPRRRRIIPFLCSLILIYWSLYYLFWSATSVRWSSSLSEKKPTLFIAANLYNNQDILDHWTTQVLKLAQWAGPNRSYISIFENGSTDNTKALLLKFKTRLTQENIPHTIILDDTPKDYTERRIPMLANRRNQALSPLYRRDLDYDKILFLNDIWFDWMDAVRLIQSGYSNNNSMDIDEEYDAVCSMDFFGQYYDEFATREIDTNWLGSGEYPYFKDQTSRDLLKHRKLIPVYSCWGGMVSFKASPFLMVNSTTGTPLLSFRSLWPDNPRPILEASECCLVHSDLRALNFTNIFINPNVKVAYDHFHYWYANYLLPLRNLVLSWTNEPKGISAEENIKWKERLASVGQLDSGDSICLWRPGSYD
ncbi:cryptococcal mannosyltransferase 1-domain-containing protein [Halteromyces radiatus]|uniref:cryptococcal mannosyltransferase 1-domain-containing protein n=1 Tax=Halteromyces radiatus TaxID=101107 RepID=UPI00222104A6|nr:cryptococcal mannosyltransferase 1-domain-containing protein [Halteromyces radiatus]KAI8099642.1 cryptococcal mannosyltransferase 1-domain-containing protein [Halteromyces radiatus]